MSEIFYYQPLSKPQSQAVNAIYEPYVDSQISDHQETHIFQMKIHIAEAGEIGA